MEKLWLIIYLIILSCDVIKQYEPKYWFLRYEQLKGKNFLCFLLFCKILSLKMTKIGLCLSGVNTQYVKIQFKF